MKEKQDSRSRKKDKFSEDNQSHDENGATNLGEKPTIESVDKEQSSRIDLNELRLSQNFDEVVGVRKKIVTVPVRKPHRQWFVRVHPDTSYRLDTAILEIKEEREIFLVDRPLWPELMDEIKATTFLTTINRQEVVFLWPIPLPDPHGRQMAWHTSAREAAQEAMTNWVRVAANMSLGAYEIFVAGGDLPEPGWPEISFRELLEIAFKDNFIRSLDHPAIRRLRGEI